MPRSPRITAPDVLRVLHRAGWRIERQRGSHALCRHPEQPTRRVVVPVHAGRILKPKTLASILDQAGLSIDELMQLL